MIIRFLMNRRTSRQGSDLGITRVSNTESNEIPAETQPDSTIRSEKISQIYRKLKILRALFEAGQISQDDYELQKADLLRVL